MNKEKEVYIWGSGAGFEVVSLCIKENSVVGCIDNDKYKWGNRIYGLNIYSPKEIDLKNSRIIISVVKYLEIKEELVNKGCSLENLYFFWDEREKGNFGNIILERSREEQLKILQEKKSIMGM